MVQHGWAERCGQEHQLVLSSFSFNRPFPSAAEILICGIDSLAGIFLLHTGDSFPYLKISLSLSHLFWTLSPIPIYGWLQRLLSFRAKLPPKVYICYLNVSTSHFTPFLREFCLYYSTENVLTKGILWNAHCKI